MSRVESVHEVINQLFSGQQIIFSKTHFSDACVQITFERFAAESLTFPPEVDRDQKQSVNSGNNGFIVTPRGQRSSGEEESKFM
ncbi:uncharacterized protein V6R79_008596 [Siganus canaliculatus]